MVTVNSNSVCDSSVAVTVCMLNDRRLPLAADLNYGFQPYISQFGFDFKLKKCFQTADYMANNIKLPASDRFLDFKLNLLTAMLLP